MAGGEGVRGAHRNRADRAHRPTHRARLGPDPNRADRYAGAMAIASVRTAEAGGGLRDAAALGLDRPALVRILHSLLLTRRLDERGHVLFKQGKLPGSFYTCKGNEAASVGVAAAMAPGDLAAPLHRNLGL